MFNISSVATHLVPTYHPPHFTNSYQQYYVLVMLAELLGELRQIKYLLLFRGGCEFILFLAICFHSNLIPGQTRILKVLSRLYFNVSSNWHSHIKFADTETASKY